MKIPILFKFLHIYKTQKIGNFPHTKPRKGDEGFTLLEVLAIALIVGILSSIAAPGWLAFINNQRLRASLSRVSAVMQLAQSNAKRDKISWQASFREQGDFVEVALHRADVSNTDLNNFKEVPLDNASENTWIKLEQSIVLDTANTKSFEQVSGVYKAIFNRQGCLVQNKDFECTDNPPSFTPKQVTLNINKDKIPSKKCVIVQTVLGSIRNDEGAGCQ